MKELRRLNIGVDERVFTKLVEDAKRSGMPVSVYAGVLFNAAYAARCGETGDRDLDATVAAALLLQAGGLDSSQVARALRCSEATVERIRMAWKDATLGESP